MDTSQVRGTLNPKPYPSRAHTPSNNLGLTLELLGGPLREVPNPKMLSRDWGLRGSGFRVRGLGFRVEGSGFRVESLGFRV